MGKQMLEFLGSVAAIAIGLMAGQMLIDWYKG